MALALYRKYRPRTFGEVIGQEHVTEPLSQALRSGRLHHAYLFSGPRGCGKTSSARILARSLNCANGPTPEPCGECQSCRDLAPDGAGSIDVIEIDAASHGGVDDARELRERAFFAPVSSRFKVYVIDEAHMVSSAGFNALLKLVEEPPEYVKFVFATTEPEKVLGTIKSRTHHYPFRLIPPGVLRPYLETLCEREGAKVEPTIFPLVVRAGAGSVRDSLSVLDQLIAGAGPDGVSYSRAVALLGVTDAALIDEMCDALAAGDGATAYATVDRVAEAGHDPRRFASDLLERLRDLIILQQVPDAVAKGLLDAPDDQLERMAAQAARLGPATLSRFADIVHNGLTEMRGTTAPRLLLELITARMLLPGADDSSSALLQRLERMERRLGAAGEQAPALPPTAPVAQMAPPVVAPPTVTPSAPSAPAVAPPRSAPAAPSPSAPAVAPPPAAPPATASAPGRPSAAPTDLASVDPVQADPVQADPVQADPMQAERPVVEPGAPAQPAPATHASAEGRTPGVLDAAAVRRVWDDEILSTVRRKKPRVAALMREATVREVEGNTLVLLFRHSVHAEMLAKSPEVLTQAITEVFGGTWQLRCEVGGAQTGAPRGAGAQRSAPGHAQPPSQVSTPSPGRATASPRSSRPASGPRADEAADEGDDGWPTPAQPGGGSAPVTGGDAAPTAEDWPTPARPGGQAAASDLDGPGGAAAPVPPAPTATATQTASGRSGPAASAQAMPAAPSAEGRSAAAPSAEGRSAAAAAARAAAAGLSGRQVAAGRPTGSAPAAAASPATSSQPGAVARNGGGSRDGSALDEPPYDPDYDPPVHDPQYPGFDPGDEPTDVVLDERVVRESTEEQALRLLAEALGAEKIDDGRR